MKQISQSFKALLLVAAFSLPAMAFAAEPAMMKGDMMVDHKGMTLYTFDKDTGGKFSAHWPVSGVLATVDCRGGCQG